MPTKKDKTLVEILDRLRNLDDRLLNLENKVDAVGRNQQAAIGSTPLYPAGNFAGTQVPSGIMHPAFAMPLMAYQLPDQYKYVSAVHRMLSWPAIQQLFLSVQPRLHNVDLSAIEREGVSHMIGIRKSNGHFIPGSASVVPTDQNPEFTSHLTWEYVQRVSKTYFDSINLQNPILDRQSFMGETLPNMFSQGFKSGIESTVCYLVFALGEVASTGSDGVPTHVYNGRASGVKGGTTDRPPGIELFNEARRRIGFHLTECSLENVQVFALSSAYYGSCFYPMDFWRMTASASLACQAMVTSNPTALSSPRADLVKRIFWYCSIMETTTHLELEFPLTGLERMESAVGLPDFSGPFSEDDILSNQQSHFQEHFASQIALRRLLIDFHGKLSQGTVSSGGQSPSFVTSPETSGQASPLLIQQMAGELEEWRGMLPPHIRWQEDTPGAFPDSNEDPYNLSVSLHTPTNTPVSPTMPNAQGVPGSPPLMFSTDLDSPPARYSYLLDVQVAMLRSKYYHAKYLIYRPFVYKALHYPDAITHDDAVGVAECLRASLKWPIAMSPTCKQKRLIPCLFFFTQNLFGILVLLHLSTQMPILRRIRNTLCGERFEIEANETVELYLDWLRDLKPIDVGTAWHWEVVKAIYGVDE